MERVRLDLPSDLLELLDVSWKPEAGGLDAFLGHFLERCEVWFRASGASIFLRGRDAGYFLLAAKAGSDSHIPVDAKVVDGEGIAGAAVRSGEALLVGDPKEHPMLAVAAPEHRRSIGSALVVPLSLAGAPCIGVLNLSRPAEEEPFTEVELGTAKALARFMALAVSNARLFAETTASRERLEAVVGCLGVAVVVVDANGKVAIQNAEANRQLGAKELWPRFGGATELLRSQLEVALKAALLGESTRTRVRDDNADRAWSLVATPIPSGGATLSIEEVTEEERAMAERARLSRLAEIGQMTAAIAHEIRNPLTGIRGAAQMVAGGGADATTFGRIIEQEAIKLNDLCDEFLDFSKPIALRFNDLDTREIVRRVLDSHRHQFDKAGVRLVVDLSSPSCFMADEARIEQVLRNLLLNALQACGRGDTVTVETTAEGFAVEDSGCGIDATQLGRLFTPFFTTKPKGTGLGLSTVRKIVEAHGGQLKVDSVAGKGSKFEVCLPTQQRAALRKSA